MGPKPRTGKAAKRIPPTQSGRCLLGTTRSSISESFLNNRHVLALHSGIAMVNEICTAPARPFKAFAAMSAPIDPAVAATMFPTTANIFPPMKNHLRPKISDRRPTSRKATESARVLESATQLMFLDGPKSVFNKPRTFEESTQPAAADMYPKASACVFESAFGVSNCFHRVAYDDCAYESWTVVVVGGEVGAQGFRADIKGLIVSGFRRLMFETRILGHFKLGLLSRTSFDHLDCQRCRVDESWWLKGGVGSSKVYIILTVSLEPPFPNGLDLRSISHARPCAFRLILPQRPRQIVRSKSRVTSHPAQ